MGRFARAVLGILLIAGGVLFLLINNGLITFGALIWAAIFGVAGLAFLVIFGLNREQWWALIPGMTLLGLMGLIGAQELIPGLPESLGPGIFLGMIGLSFLLIYLINRAHWWAVIPGGVLWSVAFVAGFSDVFQGLELAGFMFFGIALTFALVAVLPTPQGRMAWAWIPAGVLLVIGILITSSFVQLINYLWPVALVLTGLFLILRSLLTHGGE
jgi:hypothetical protein